MARPRCDQFDAPAIRAAIKRGETTERAAYMTYAAQAGRPYARSTFSLILRNASDPEPEPVASADHAPDRWRDRAPVKPRILALSAGGGLRVKAGSLIVFDGASTLTYSSSAKPPLAIVLSTVGGFVSIEAVRFCARRSVAIVALDRAHGFLTVIGGKPKSSASLLRAQIQADPVPIARAIVAAKISALAHVRGLARAEPFAHAIEHAANLDHVRSIEAQASRVAWPDAPSLRWEAGSIPPDWKAPWLMRTRLDAKGKRGARHPINAMLNATFSVTGGRLAAYLAATGLSPAIGFLHADKAGRWSLAWDAIEPLRPMIEARLFRFAARERFAAADFVRSADGSIRLAPGLLSAVLNECAPPSHTLAQAVRWLARMIAAGRPIAGAGEAGGGRAEAIEGSGPADRERVLARPLVAVAARSKG